MEPHPHTLSAEGLRALDRGRWHYAIEHALAENRKAFPGVFTLQAYQDLGAYMHRRPPPQSHQDVRDEWRAIDLQMHAEFQVARDLQEVLLALFHPGSVLTVRPTRDRISDRVWQANVDWALERLSVYAGSHLEQIRAEVYASSSAPERPYSRMDSKMGERLLRLAARQAVLGVLIETLVWRAEDRR